MIQRVGGVSQTGILAFEGKGQEVQDVALYVSEEGFFLFGPQNHFTAFAYQVQSCCSA